MVDKLNPIDNELADNASWIHEPTATILIKQIKGHTDSIINCQFICDDSKIFTVSNDQTARVWDAKTGKELKIFKELHKSVISKGKVNKENTHFFTCSWDGSIKYWDLITGHKMWENQHEYMITSGDVSNDCQLVISVSDVDLIIKVWEAKTGKLSKKICGLHSITITSLYFSPAGDRIITTSMDKTCKMYDLNSSTNTITLGGHFGIVSNSSFSTDQRFLATTSWDKTINIYDISTGAYRLDGPLTFEHGHEGSVSSCKISHDATMVVSVGYDTNLILWDINMPKPKLVLKTHNDWITDVDISNDNKWIISVSRNGDILQWQIENADKIKNVVQQKATLNIVSTKCSNCQKGFMMQKLKRIKKGDEEKILCVFCRMEASSSNSIFLTEA